MIFYRQDARDAKGGKRQISLSPPTPPLTKGVGGILSKRGFWVPFTLRYLLLCVEQAVRFLRAQFEARAVTRTELIRDLADRGPWTQDEALIAIQLIAARGNLFVIASPMLPPGKLADGVRAIAYRNLEKHRSN